MALDVKSKLFSFESISIAVGAVGFISAFASMFFDMSSKVSISWPVGLTWIFVTIIVILGKLIVDLLHEKRPALAFETPIKYKTAEKIFIIRKNENFVNSIVVGCWQTSDDIESLAYVAVVHHVQDQFIQLRVIRDLGIILADPSGNDILKTLVIKSSIPMNAFERLDNE